MVLTCEEESILGRMRNIKEQVRPIADRLFELQGNVSARPQDSDSEWARLSAQLEDLRTQWKEWSERLEGAIERKLIALGHREPTAPRS
jgi:predicted nuclease with TOPRIM domain